MLQAVFRKRRHAIFIALCFVCIIGFSTFTPLERVADVRDVPSEKRRGDYTPSDIDYTALWNRTYGGFDSDRFYDLVLCDDGGYALTGVTQSFNSTDRNTWVIRTDNEGEPLWTKNIGYNGVTDEGYSIYQCMNGDFVISGSYSTVGGTNGFVTRIGDDGNVLWTYEIGLSSSYENFIDAIESSSGSIIAVGTTDAWGAGLDDVMVVSLSPIGEPVWIRTYGGVVDDLGRAIIESKDGGYAVLANTYSYSIGGSDFWLLRLDRDGNLLWSQVYGGGNEERGFDLIEYSAGGFVMVGQTRSFGDLAGDYYVVRVDADGGLVWDEYYVGSGEDYATGIIQSSRGGFAIIGMVDYIGLNPQARITRIQPDSTEIWSSFYGGADVDYGYGIIEVRPEEYVVGGTSRSYGSGDFDGWLFLVPGMPRLLTHLVDLFFEYGEYPYAELWVESTADIDSWWIDDTSVFDIVGNQESAFVYTMNPPDVGIYEIWVHVNNTAGYEEEDWFNIHVNDWTSPHWTTAPEDQTLEFGEQLRYQLNADDLAGLKEWSLTGSTQFVVDSNGEITSVQTPAVGEYSLEVSVIDNNYNTLSTTLHVSVQDTIAPQWDETPQDQTMTYGSPFVYDLNASDLSGILSWWVDNPEFCVEWKGCVRNLIPLAHGDHGVTVYVSDIHGNVLQGQFIVTVEYLDGITEPDGTPGILEIVVPFGGGVVATVAVAAAIYVVGRRKSAPSK
jgi:hypothetical protein